VPLLAHNPIVRIITTLGQDKIADELDEIALLKWTSEGAQ